MLHGGRNHTLALATRRNGQGELLDFGVGAPAGFQDRLVIQDRDGSLGAIRARFLGAAASAVIEGGFIVIDDKAANPRRRQSGARCHGQHGGNQEMSFEAVHLVGNLKKRRQTALHG